MCQFLLNYVEIICVCAASFITAEQKLLLHFKQGLNVATEQSAGVASIVVDNTATTNNTDCNIVDNTVGITKDSITSSNTNKLVATGVKLLPFTDSCQLVQLRLAGASQDNLKITLEVSLPGTEFAD